MSQFAKLLTGAALCVAGLGQLSLAGAESTGAVRLISGHRAEAAQMRMQTAQAASAARAAAVQAGTHAAGGVTPAGEVFANIDRAYPPSCLNSPISLGLFVNDANRAQAQITLYGDPLAASAAEQNFHETDTVTVFRVPCSGGKSAVLIEIDRPANHDTTNYPVFPNVYGGKIVSGGNPTQFALRLANDPNTFYTSTYSFSPLVNSDVFVLENFYNPSATVSTQTFDFTQAFHVYVDNLNQADPIVDFSVSAFNAANFNNYPSAANPMEITGYMSTNWTSPTQGGEGIVMQVYDNGDHASRTLAFAWFTYDANKRAFWLFGQANVPYGSQQISSQAVYFTNGTFAGTSATGLPFTAAGVVTFKFPDCAHMHVAWNIDASSTNGPKGQGSATYQRVADVNGLVCQ